MAADAELAVVLKLVADQFQAELKKSHGLLGGFSKAISDWRVQLGAVATTLFAVAKSTANYGEELLRNAQRAGVSVEALAGLEHAAELSETNIDALVRGLKGLSQNMVEAATGTGDGKRAFDQLGVSAVDAEGKLRPTVDVLLDVADVMAQAQDGAGKTALQVKLLGKSGQELAPLLNQGKAGIVAMMEEAKRLGKVMSEEDARAADQMNDQLTKLQSGIRGLVNALGVQLIPTIRELAEILTTLTDPKQGFGLIAWLLQKGQANLIGFNLLLKEFIAHWKALKSDKPWKEAFDDLGKEIDRIEAEAKLKFFLLVHPEARGLLEPPKAAGAARPGAALALPASAEAQTKVLEAHLKAVQDGLQRELALRKAQGERVVAQVQLDQARILLTQEQATQQLGELKNEEFSATADTLKREVAAYEAFVGQRRALGFKSKEEQQAFETEAADKLKGLQQAVVENQIRWDAEGLKFHREVTDQRTAKDRESLQLYLEGLRSMAAGRQEDLADEVKLAQARLEAADAGFASFDELAARRLEVLEAERDRELAVADQTEKQKLAIKIKYDALIHRERLVAEGGLLAVVQVGLHEYLTNTENTFNLALDITRQTFDAMAQASKTFFFDVLKGRIVTLQQAFQGLLNFVQQILAQIASQLVTAQVLRGVGALFPNLFNVTPPAASTTGSSLVPPGAPYTASVVMLQHGGIGDFGAGTLAMLHGREKVVPLDQAHEGMPIEINVFNQVSGAEVQAKSRSGEDGRRVIDLIVKKAVGDAVNSGEFDRMLHMNYGLKRRGFGR